MDINTVLENWHEAKEQKSKYEKKCDLYKDAIERYMDKKKINLINGKHYTVSRRTNIKQILTKNNTPPEIWDQYATKFTYRSYYLKTNNKIN